MTKAKRERELAELVGAVQRLLRALGRRAAEGDPEALCEMQTLRHELDAAILTAVAGQRAAGITWESIGEATGTTRQAALMKWGPKLPTADRVAER